MKQIIKANVNCKGTLVFDMPQYADENDIIQYILENASDIEWKELKESDVAYEVIDDYIKEDTDKDEPDGYDEYRISNGIDF